MRILIQSKFIPPDDLQQTSKLLKLQGVMQDSQRQLNTVIIVC